MGQATVQPLPADASSTSGCGVGEEPSASGGDRAAQQGSGPGKPEESAQSSCRPAPWRHLEVAAHGDSRPLAERAAGHPMTLSGTAARGDTGAVVMLPRPQQKRTASPRRPHPQSAAASGMVRARGWRGIFFTSATCAGLACNTVAGRQIGSSINPGLSAHLTPNPLTGPPQAASLELRPGPPRARQPALPPHHSAERGAQAPGGKGGGRPAAGLRQAAASRRPAYKGHHPKQQSSSHRPVRARRVAEVLCASQAPAGNRWRQQPRRAPARRPSCPSGALLDDEVGAAAWERSGRCRQQGAEPRRRAFSGGARTCIGPRAAAPGAAVQLR